MKLGISHLNNEAAKLILLKNEISADDYHRQLEDLVEKMALLNNQNPEVSSSYDSDLMEKISFEIRTPMNSILGFTRLLKDNYFSSEEKENFLELIEKNTENLVQLLSDLTDLTKIENHQVAVRFKEFEFNVFILNIISNYYETAKEKNIIIDKKVNPNFGDNICVSTDPYHLQHIIDILLSNLISVSENNRIRVKANIEDHAFLTLHILSENMELSEIMNKRIQQQISQPPQEPSFDGTGLRLTLTKALVDLLKGEIKFQITPKKGSEFFVKIPIKMCQISS